MRGEGDYHLVRSKVGETIAKQVSGNGSDIYSQLLGCCCLIIASRYLSTIRGNPYRDPLSYPVEFGIQQGVDLTDFLFQLFEREKSEGCREF